MSGKMHIGVFRISGVVAQLCVCICMLHCARLIDITTQQSQMQHSFKSDCSPGMK